MSSVQRRLLNWVGLAVGLLLVSSSFCYIVRAVAPKPEKYNYPYAYSPASPPLIPRPDLMNRSPTEFNSARNPTPADVTEFVPLFDSLGEAGRTQNQSNYLFLWNTDRYAEEVWSQVAKWSNTTPTDAQVRGTAAEASGSVASLDWDPSLAFRADKTELLKVARSRNDQEAMIVARHRTKVNGVPVTSSTRWWLIRSPNIGWQIYDRDYPLSRMRASTRIAGYEWETVTGLANAGLPSRMGGPGGAPAGGDTSNPTPIAALDSALLVSLDAPFYSLDYSLGNCRGVNLPPPWAAARSVVEAQLLLQKGEPQSAAKHLDMATRHDPTYPRTHLLRGVAATRLGDHEEALKHLATYRTMVGPDAEAARTTGAAQEGLKKTADAQATYRAAVKDFPDHNPLYIALAQALPANQKGEAGEWAAKGPTPALHLRTILNGPEADDVALADAVVAGFRAVRSDDPDGMSAAAVVRVRQGKLSEATTLLLKARDAAEDDKRDGLRSVFLSEMIRYHIPLAGYRAIPAVDRATAFRWLASDLLDQMDGLDNPAAGPLLELIVAHRAAMPADPWGEYWLAELFALDKRLDRANDLLAAAMARLSKPTRPPPKPDPERPFEQLLTDEEITWDQFRFNRVRCLAQLGRWREAYRDLPPEESTFNQLTLELEQAKDATALAELVALHEKAMPDDVEVIFWRGKVHWLRKETAKAVDLYAEYRTKAGVTSIHRWDADEQRVRGLVRLGRTDEARQVLLDSDMISQSLPLQAVVAASAVDKVRLYEILASWAALGVPSRVFYEDEDLGPVLRGDKFPELRAKYPPP